MRALLWIGVAACGTWGSVDVRADLEAVCEAIGVPVVSGIPLPRVERVMEPVPTRGIYLDVRATQVSVNGHTFARAEEIRLPLRAARMAAEKRGRIPALIVSAPAELPADRVAAALDVARELGIDTGHALAFSPQAIVMPPPVDPAYAADLDSRIGSLHVTKRSQPVAQELQGLLKSCPAAGKAMQAVAIAPESGRCQALAENLGETLPSCSPQDARKIATLARFMATPAYENRPTAIPLTLAADGPAVPVGGTWQQSVSRLAGAKGE